MACHVRLHDHDAKRLHLLIDMVKEDGGRAAFVETLLMNVDLEARRAAAYPDWAIARFAAMQAAHAALPAPPFLGGVIGIRR